MASCSELYVGSGDVKNEVEYEPLQTPPTLLPETPLVDIYAGPGVIDSTSSEADIGIAATETVYLSTSAYAMPEPDNDQQEIDVKLDTPETSLTQIFVVHQPALTYKELHPTDHGSNIMEQVYTHVDGSDCVPENIPQVMEIEEADGIVLVMQGECELLSVDGSFSTTSTDALCMGATVKTDAEKSHHEEMSTSLIKSGSNVKSKPTKMCLQVVREDGSVHSMNVIPVTFRGGRKTVPSSSERKTVVYNEKAAKEDRLFMCDLCDKTFNRPGNYKRHRMIHIVNTEENQRYKCEVCNRPFLQRCDLKRHMQVHSGKEPFRCEVCDKGYIRRSDLVVHMRFHNKERLFKCDSCDKMFHQSGDLRRHVRLVHAKTKVLLCRHCPSRYTTETTFLRHMQTAHRDIILKSLDDVSPLVDPVASVSDDVSRTSDRKNTLSPSTTTSSSSKTDLLETSSSSLSSSNSSVSASSSSSESSRHCSLKH